MSNKAALNFHVLTLFPEIFKGPLTSSLLGKAVDAGKVGVFLHQIRDHAKDKHHTVDDTPYGGGEGMVMRADVLHACWKKAKESATGAHTILLTPQGKPLTQKRVTELAAMKSLIVVCGHYEGVDERFVEKCVDEEISIGDYVLTGGELAACVLIDAVSRVIPGVVGNPRSLSEETFEGDLLKYPQYTRPPEFEGLKVPEVLVSGNHKAIAEWREKQRSERTKKRRPDL